MEDQRFKHIVADPKFRRIPKGTQKVKIDKRFKSMFKDKKFKVKYTVDKRGRPVNHNSSEDLKRYYDLSSDESSEEESESEENQEDDDNDKISGESDSETVLEEANQKTDKVVKVEQRKKSKQKSDCIPDEIKKKLSNLTVDYARGEAPLISESSSDDEESEEELSESEQIEHKWGELDADADNTEEATCRLAACNMDWDRIRAVDLMVLFNSFLPAGGVIKSVTIYPSEFGKQRMQEEEVKGPIELVSTTTSEVKDENEEGAEYHMEKLRQYQLNRLKYYYAVIVFDSPQSANKIYTECDGMEYESSAIKLDLRFIPDDMTFDDKPKDFSEKLPEINKYQPRFFTTTALQQVKVDLTWDETNPERVELAQKLNSGKVDDISEADLQNYLASSSGEEQDSEDENNEVDSDTESKADIIDKYKTLLQSIEEKDKSKTEKDVELEISWGIDLKEKTEKLAKERQSNSEGTTPFQKYLEKRKERRKEKRQQKKKKVAENGSEDEIPSDIDIKDPYFAEEFNKPEFKKQKSKEIVERDSDGDTDQKQAELDLILMNEDDNKNHFSLKKIQEIEANNTKKKKKQIKEQSEDNFEIDVKDQRFSALFTSHHFNIDPTDSHYKKTKAMEALINEKLKRRVTDPALDEIPFKIRKSSSSIEELNKSKNTELNMLVKSVKRKTKQYKNKG